MNNKHDLLEPNSYVIGIDIGGTNFRMGAVLRCGNVLHSKVVSSRKLFLTGNPVITLADNIREFVKEVTGTLVGICIGFPGTVSKNKTTVYSCPNLPMFDGKNISHYLEGQFAVPVIIEHEVILLLSNDIEQYGLAHKDCVIAIYVGTGLGNALYIHGRFLEGKNGSSGELGHIAIAGNKQACPCGNIGCIEQFASGKRLEDIHDTYFPETRNFDEMLMAFSEHAVIDDYINHIAIAVSIEINILDPDNILLGGGVINIPSFPYEKLINRIRFHVRKPLPENNLKFIRVEENSLQGIRGASMYFWNYFCKG